MSRLIVLEWVVIVAALLSLWPAILGYHENLYRGWLAGMVIALVWVTRNRLSRIRQAAAEAKRLQEELDRRQVKPLI
jgi:hypothetical protein